MVQSRLRADKAAALMERIGRIYTAPIWTRITMMLLMILLKTNRRRTYETYYQVVKTFFRGGNARRSVCKSISNVVRDDGEV